MSSSTILHNLQTIDKKQHRTERCDAKINAIDRQDTPLPTVPEPSDFCREPEIKDPYFDEMIGAWVMSRYADVAAAFRSASLLPVGPRSRCRAEQRDDAARLEMRAETSQALSRAALERWRGELGSLAGKLLDAMPTDSPVDLVADYGQPLCRFMAMSVTGTPTNDKEAKLKIELAQQISAAAAEPFDIALAARAKNAEAELGRHFHSGPVPLRESGFVALSQTLSFLLARSWYLLLRQPAEWTDLHHDIRLHRANWSHVVEGLLRQAGLTRILFRMAASDTHVNGTPIREGERVVLRLLAANRDPAQFPVVEPICPASAGENKQVSLGLGKHACVAAPLIRMVITTTTQQMVERFASAVLSREPKWQGGSGFLFPVALVVALQR